jgi:Zn-finger nucleic acid-binding protein
MKRKHVVIDRTTGQIVRVTDMDPNLDPVEALVREIHDCPECRAAIERGEVPQIFNVENAAPPPRFARRPRWRTFKRGR